VNIRDLQRYKRLLLAKLDELSETRADLASPLVVAVALRGDLIDQANARAEAELHVRLHQSDVRLLRAIEEALARLRAGTFGICENCKRPISKARLEAVPWTRLCRECKECERSAA
jgi:DnaK suppressor protein